MLSILDMYFPGQPDDSFFESACEDLDKASNTLSREERYAVYKDCIDHFHRLTRNYSAWWNELRHGIRIGNRGIDTSLYNAVIIAFKRHELGQPQEIAEGNYRLRCAVDNEHVAQALDIIMTRMLAELHMSYYARIAS